MKYSEESALPPREGTTTRAVCGMKAYPTGRRRLGLDDVPDLAGVMGVMSLAESAPVPAPR